MIFLWDKKDMDDVSTTAYTDVQNTLSDTRTRQKGALTRTHQRHPFLAHFLQRCPVKNVPINGALVNLRKSRGLPRSDIQF